MPTFCALAGYQPEHSLKWDGQNIWPFLTGVAEPPPRTIYTVGPGFRSLALRDEQWKLIVHSGADDKAERVELYDIVRDPYEETDRAAELPEKVAELRAKLNAVAANDRDAEVKE